MKTILLVLMCAAAVHAGNVVRTLDGKAYANCTMIEVKAHSVVMYVPRVGLVEIPDTLLLPGDLAKIEPQMKAVREKEARWAKQVAEEKAARIAPTLHNVTLINGTVIAASTWALEPNGETVKLHCPDGTRSVKVEMLTSEWRDKVRPLKARQEENSKAAEWSARVVNAQTALARYAGRGTARLLGAHKEGVRAVLTVQRKVGKQTLTMYPDVILKGLPQDKITGTWTGLLEAKEVYQDRASGEVYPVFWAR